MRSAAGKFYSRIQMFTSFFSNFIILHEQMALASCSSCAQSSTCACAQKPPAAFAKVSDVSRRSAAGWGTPGKILPKRFRSRGLFTFCIFNTHESDSEHVS